MTTSLLEHCGQDKLFGKMEECGLNDASQQVGAHVNQLKCELRGRLTPAFHTSLHQFIRLGEQPHYDSLPLFTLHHAHQKINR